MALCRQQIAIRQAFGKSHFGDVCHLHAVNSKRPSREGQAAPISASEVDPSHRIILLAPNQDESYFDGLVALILRRLCREIEPGFSLPIFVSRHIPYTYTAPEPALEPLIHDSARHTFHIALYTSHALPNRDRFTR
jgi:hypothetical protein